MNEPTEPTTTTEEIVGISLRVRNLQESIAFYCSLFGLTTIPARPESERSARCIPKTGDEKHHDAPFSILLTQGRPGTLFRAIDHFTLRVRDTAAVDRVAHRAISCGFRATTPRNIDDHRMAYVFDPDGNKIAVLAARDTDVRTEAELSD